MSTRTHFLTPEETKSVADALYHEGFGWLAQPDFVANVPNRIGCPGSECEILEIIDAVLQGTYRGFMVPCNQVDCELCH